MQDKSPQGNNEAPKTVKKKNKSIVTFKGTDPSMVAQTYKINKRTWKKNKDGKSE